MNEELLQQLQIEIDKLKKEIKLLNENKVTLHKHNGIDNYQINPSDLVNNPVINVSVATIGSGNPGDFQDMFFINLASGAITLGAPLGSPKNGQRLIIRIKDDGTSRNITWNAIYRAGSSVALPSATTISKIVYCIFIYNATDIKWDLIYVVNNI